jgi:hypothetical protein
MSEALKLVNAREDESQHGEAAYSKELPLWQTEDIISDNLAGAAML